MKNLTDSACVGPIILILFLLLPAAASAQVNLTPYAPSGWSDKIVVSKTSGTTSDDYPLTTVDTLYVDWAVLNSGNAATAATFYTELYIDNVLKASWYVDPPLSANYYVYVADYSLGSLASGTHTIKIKTDATNAVAESNETDNEYTKTIIVQGTTLPNLAPYTPAAWSDKIVVSKTTGTTTDDSQLIPSDALYVDWAVLNSGSAATAVRFYTELYVDGALKTSWYVDPPLNANYYIYIADYSIGSLAAGTHTIKIKTDSTNAIAESNEADNEYTKTITIGQPANLPNLTPYKPSDWTDKIVASKVTGTRVDAGAFCASDTVYIDWAVINSGAAATGVRFYTELYLDGVLKSTVYTDPPLNANNYVSVSDFSLGTLSAGNHSIRVKTDSTGVISEQVETDNEYTKTITVTGDCGFSTKKVLVLIADFSDKPGQVSRDYYQQMMFGTIPAVAPAGSFKDFFLEASYGRVLVTGDINNPTIAWIRLPQTLAYYSGGCYGIGRAGQCSVVYPQNAQRMVEDAVIAAKNLGLDFSSYDLDLDGYVDSIFIIHAGAGSEFSGNNGDIWSHKWQTTYDVDTGSTNSQGTKVKVRTYSTEPEYWVMPGDMTIGVYAHEFLHVLGAPDLYDTDYTSSGVGDWSLMAGGSWGGPSHRGDYPSHPDAWTKYFLGWITPTKVTTVLTAAPIRDAASYPDAYQLLNGSPKPATGEYFLVENRQKVKFDSYLPGSGLLIYHIDESKTSNNVEWYPGCTTCAGHYHVAVLQADNNWQLEKNVNRGDAGDPYPGVCAGQNCNTAFGAGTSPNSNLYSGAASGIAVTGISNSGSTMTATFTTSAIQVTVQTNPAGRSFTVDGTSYGSAQAFTWSSGSSHTIATTSPQSGTTGTRYVWSSWSDVGAISHIVAPTANTTYTANFTTQYYLTMNSATGGSGSPASNWFNNGQSVQIQANANSGYSFSSWTGSGTGSYTGNSNPASVTINGPIAETPAFQPTGQAKTQGDFNKDGRADLLWRHAVSGDINVWFLNGVIVLGDAWLPRVSNQQWQIAGVGDFNGDGYADILWRYTPSGDLNVWLMNGTSVASDAWLPRVSDPQWQIAGTGDFNKDGKADIVWRHAVSGDINVWFLNGGTVLSDAWLPRVSNQQWQIAGIGDFNGDGGGDIVWRYAPSGDIDVWLMNGTAVTSDAWLPRVSNQQWQINAIGDINGDGNAEVVWRHTASGEIDVWFLKGASFVSDAWLPRVSDLQWKICGPR
jgi:immune inhibitor A